MKKMFFLLVLVGIFGCQQEEFSVVAEEEENTEADLLDAQLITMIQTVAAHDGTFDDVVDRSSCFSINFPYQVFWEGEPHQINSMIDLAPIQPGDEVIPMYPIVLSFADYHNIEVSSHDEFLGLIDDCENGRLYNERVTCVDMVYPFTMAVYNVNNTNFETRRMTHDKSTFQQLEAIAEGERVSINYPIEIRWQNGSTEEVGSNDELYGLILDAKDFCQE